MSKELGTGGDHPKKSMRVGEFVSLRKEADYYLDCRMTTLHPRGLC